MNLLKTKLFAPSQRSRLISRPHLKARLDAGLSGQLTLVSAPAGFGKTTLVSEWYSAWMRGAGDRIPSSLQQPSLKIAWLSLDGDDNDPLRFLAYLAAAVETLKPGASQTSMALLRSPGPPLVKDVIANLVNSLEQASGEAPTPQARYALVLDDYHAIKAEPIHAALAYLLEHQPPWMHLTILTRTDPPLPVPRLRSRNRLAEIRAADLRFTVDETRTFLEGVMGLNLSAQEVAALEARTEGWIAGLQMAALAMQGLSMQGRQDIPGFIQAFTGSHRYIIDYLIEEVFQRQPPDLRQFMLQASILDHLYAPLCDAVTGRHDSQALLERFESANLFLTPLDDERRWYRFHQLFKDVLESRLRQSQADQLPELHRRAARWYEDNHMAETAIRHALSGGDFEQVERILGRIGGQALTTGRWSTVLDWLDAIPGSFVRRSPELCLFYAWALLLTGKWEAVESYLGTLEAIMSSRMEVPAGGDPHGQPDVLAGWRGQAATIRAQIASLQGLLPQAIEQSKQALEWLPEGDLLMRGIVAANLGFAYLTMDDYANAAQFLSQGRQASQAAGNDSMALSASNGLGRIEAAQGNLQRAAACYKEVLKIAGSRLDQAVVGAHYNMGALLYEWNDLEGALEHINQAVKLAGQLDSDRLRILCELQKVEILDARGDKSGATELLLSAQKEQSSIIAERVAVTKARLAARRDDLDFLELFLQNKTASQSSSYTSERRGEHHVRVQALLALDRLPEAGQRLEALLPLVEASRHHGALVEILSLQALLSWKLAQEEVARRVLRQALEMAEPGGYVRTFLDLGPGMQGLLKEFRSWSELGGAARAGPRLQAYAGLLLEAFVTPKAAPSRPGLFEDLSERELEILRLMAEGYTNQEIASRLYLALGTVKSHAHHIFAKLDVKNRTQAIARARDTGLLERKPPLTERNNP